MLDALVIGAGPVGLTMAAELARFGVSFRVVDAAAVPTDKSKALVLWPRTLELLEQAGCVQAFLAAGSEAHSVSVFADAQRLVHLSLQRAHSPFPYALMLPQNLTEKFLNDHLESLGGKVERSVTLVSFVEEADSVRAILRHADGSEEEVSARWLVGCDGAHSAVRHGLGIEFEGTTNASDWYLADVHADGHVPPRDEISIYFHKDGVLAFFPIPPNRYRVIADGPPSGAQRSPDPTLAEIQALLDKRGPQGVRLRDPVWLATFGINERLVSAYGKGRALLAGDAAHIHSPAGGQGMNTGMQDAFNLAWKLAFVAQGKAAQWLLDTYSPERAAVGAAVVTAADRLTLMATLRNPIAQAVRNSAYRLLGGLEIVQDHIADFMTELGINYRGSRLSQEHRGGAVHAWLVGQGVAAGDRIPDGLLRDGRRLFDLIRGTRFTLLMFEGLDARDDERATLDEIEQDVAVDGVSVHRIARDEVDLHRRFGAAHSALYLVRPDGYVGFRAQPAASGPLLQYLEALVGELQPTQA